jgi:hypothetical protein
MTGNDSSNNNRTNSLEDDSVDKWYDGVKKHDVRDADTWLVNIKMVQSLYGKSPESIAQMKPEEAYNFVLEMVRSMQNDGRSFSYIDSVIKSINDWLKFNNVEIGREVGLPLQSANVSNREKQNQSSQTQLAENNSTPIANPAIFDTNLLSLLNEKSEMLLSAHGENFISSIRHLETLLAKFDPAQDSMIHDIDNAVNKGVAMDLGAYYLVAYSSTKDPHKALKVYELTNSLMRYIALIDGYYETGDKDNFNRANNLLEEIICHSNSQMRYSIKLSVEKFWPFWLFENMIKQRMLSGASFTDKELRYFILFKSSDTPLLYCNILDNLLETFSPNVAIVFHYNQALIDILDDYYDLEEDLEARMPNVFLLASSNDSSFSELEANYQNIRSVIASGEARNKILSLVDWIAARIGEISLPVEYAFLRSITTDHIQRLKSTIL